MLIIMVLLEPMNTDNTSQTALTLSLSSSTLTTCLMAAEWNTPNHSHLLHPEFDGVPFIAQAADPCQLLRGVGQPQGVPEQGKDYHRSQSSTGLRPNQ